MDCRSTGSGAVASPVGVVRDDAAPLVFIDIDGEPLRVTAIETGEDGTAFTVGVSIGS